MSVLKITSENYEQEVSKAEKPVLIDFYAEWCGPCQTMSPIIDQIAEEMGENAKKIRDVLTVEKMSETCLIFVELVIQKNIIK